ncbi:F-box/LRR-repeat protein [Schistosoma japonicum]|uniref:F-box and leucine-rich repeat protein 20 n=2 Tax=Schistosoma japonicum TaxID=6182 RepID=C1LEF8_SCHJA|nr:F-box/LRR-repeat protein 20 [Schistosoma japonicum]TNN13812.1 F-box/LRR-repeat protein [Schistosoma japonicum]CAX73086.1 F-box and leucine-rich repeat protein 20 [Schistosoma japonicum]
MENFPNYFHANGSVVANGKTNSHSKNNICINDSLPKELIIRVFSYLDITTLCKCSQVCKFWYECAFDGSNWKSINLFDFQRYVQPKVVEKIAQRSRGFLRELRLKGCRNVTDEALKCFTELCHMIESLDLSGCQNLTNGTCDYLGKNCSLLTTLSLESCSRVDDTGLEMLSWCSNLTCLDVSWCSVGDRGLTAIAKGCKNLQRFRAVGCQEITSRGVEQLARHCHSLLLLNLNYCGQGVTDEAMVHLSIGCPDLRVLAVSHCSITDQGLRAIAGTLSPGAAAAIVGQATSNSQQNGIPLILPVVTSNGNANHQDASSANNTADNNNYGDLSANGRLQKGSDSNKTLLVPVGCVSLTTLEVARCSAITDIGLSAIARVCNKLEKLDLEDCALVTDSTLAQLAVHCPRLNTLVLSHCDQVTDEGIARLAEGLCGTDQLQTLAMDNCPLLTDAALEHLGSNCRKLRQLDLYDCQLITKQGINSLEVHYPQLQIHAYFAPGTPPALTFARRRRYCRCCRII